MRASQFLIALGVVVAGVCIAWPFRRPPAAAPRPASAPISIDLPLRGRDVTLAPSPPGAASPAEGLSAAAAGDYSSVLAASHTVARPDLRLLAPPPAMPLAFAGEGDSPRPPPRLTSQKSAPLRTYRLRDGDTLEWIAERHLGSRDRANELFTANRDLLTRPDLLPVGIEIKLPPREPGQ